MVTVRRLPDAPAFLDAVGAHLAEREAEHNLLFGIAGDLGLEHQQGIRRPFAPYFASIDDGDRVIGAALWTPPRNLILSIVDGPVSEAMAALAEDLSGVPTPLPGVLGRGGEWRAFAGAWCPPRDLVPRVETGERIHRLEALVPPRGVPGSARVATAEDRPMLIEWTQGFMRDAYGEPDPSEAASIIERALRLGSRRFFLWEVDGRPVSYAAAGGKTPTGGRIGPVYTPPEHRGHGYAAAATAAATRSILEGGARVVFLLTDVDNPAAERVYARLGYRPVIDVDVVRFDAAGTPAAS